MNKSASLPEASHRQLSPGKGAGFFVLGIGMDKIKGYAIDAAVWSLVISGFFYGVDWAENAAIFALWVIAIVSILVAVIMVAASNEPRMMETAEQIRRQTRLSRYIARVSCFGKIAVLAAMGAFWTAGVMCFAVAVFALGKGALLEATKDADQ